MKRNELPRVIWIQFYGEDERTDELPEIDADTTWSWEKIFDSDVRYVIDKRQVRKPKKG